MKSDLNSIHLGHHVTDFIGIRSWHDKGLNHTGEKPPPRSGGKPPGPSRLLRTSTIVPPQLNLFRLLLPEHATPLTPREDPPSLLLLTPQRLTFESRGPHLCWDPAGCSLGPSLWRIPVPWSWSQAQGISSPLTFRILSPATSSSLLTAFTMKFIVSFQNKTSSRECFDKSKF